MKWDLVRRTWEQLGGKVKKRWARLIDDDLTAIAGKRDRLAGRLQDRGPGNRKSLAA